jgi:hypothetical protein
VTGTRTSASKTKALDKAAKLLALAKVIYTPTIY